MAGIGVYHELLPTPAGRAAAVPRLRVAIRYANLPLLTMQLGRAGDPVRLRFEDRFRREQLGMLQEDARIQAFYEEVLA